MWTDKAKREAVAIALVVTTTLGGVHIEKAAAGTPKRVAPVQRVVESHGDPVEAAWGYGDLLERVQYELGYEADARDQRRLDAACRDLLGVEPPGGALGETAGPIIRYCKHADESLAAEAPDAFTRYRELSFDVTN